MTKFKVFRNKDKKKIKKAVVVAFGLMIFIFYIWFLIYSHGKSQ